MESESRIRQWINKVTDSLNEQEWFQQLKSKWDDLDPQSRLYLKFAAAGGGAILSFLILLSAMWSVHSLKSEYTDKKELLSTIESANDELRRLRSTNEGMANAAGAPQGNWNDYIQSTATGQGIDPSSVAVSPEKPGTASETSKESLIDVTIKHVSIKQIVRYALQLETGGRPIKLRSVNIDTKADPTGYMDATLSVSAFSLVSK